MSRGRDARVNGINPLQYMGDNALTPPNVKRYSRAPTTADSKNFIVGDMWIDESVSPPDGYMLVAVSAGSATWIDITSTGLTPPWIVSQGGTGLTSITDHSLVVGSGTAALTELGVATDGQLIIGSSAADPVLATLTAGTGISIANAAGSITITNSNGTLTPPWTVAQGGTGATTLTSHGLLVGNGTSAVTALAEASDGQIPIGSTGNNPVLATLTAGAGIGITNGAGSITITNTGSGGAGTCSFLAYNPTLYASYLHQDFVGVGSVIAEAFDVGNDFFPGDGAGTPATFTAPVTGKYMLTFSTSGSNNTVAGIITTTREYYSAGQSGVSYMATQVICVLTDMTVGDTAKYVFKDGISGLLVSGYFTGAYRVYMSGYLVG